MPPSDGTRKSSAVPLLEDLGEEELARDWTLSEADRAQVLRCRGEDNRRRFAVQLCMLRRYGRFLDDFAGVPVRILNHIGRQLGLAPVLSLGRSDREATEIEYEQRLRDYLGYRSFETAARANLEEHLQIAAGAGHAPGTAQAGNRRCPAILARDSPGRFDAAAPGRFHCRNRPPGDLRPDRRPPEPART
jgi:hypothetical protein